MGRGPKRGPRASPENRGGRTSVLITLPDMPEGCRQARERRGSWGKIYQPNIGAQTKGVGGLENPFKMGRGRRPWGPRKSPRLSRGWNLAPNRSSPSPGTIGGRTTMKTPGYSPVIARPGGQKPKRRGAKQCRAAAI